MDACRAKTSAKRSGLVHDSRPAKTAHPKFPLNHLGSARTQKNFEMKKDALTMAVDHYKDEVKNGNDDQLKTFATETLPKLKAHLEQAKALAKAHGGDAGQ